MGDMTAFPLGLELSWKTGLAAIGVSVVLFIVAHAVVALIIVRLPADYFRDFSASSPKIRLHPARHWALVIARNVLGGMAAILGVVLLLPGVPGPGLVLILIAAMLLDFPGKHRLIENLVRRKSVLGTLNRLRARFGRPPLIVDQPQVAFKPPHDHR